MTTLSAAVKHLMSLTLFEGDSSLLDSDGDFTRPACAVASFDDGDPKHEAAEDEDEEDEEIDKETAAAALAEFRVIVDD